MKEQIALVGDLFGIQQLLQTQVIAPASIACLVAASIRPQYLPMLQRLAEDLKVPLLIQPKYQTAAYAQFLKQFIACRPKMLLCNSYAMLLRADLLEVVSGRGYNVHWALLPQNRGPNPVQWALIKGQKETGITLHRIVQEVDAGAILAQAHLEIAFEETWVTLSEKLSKLSHNCLCEWLPQLLAGKLAESAQDEARATINKRLTPDSPRLDFRQMSDQQIYHLMRAQVAPLKGAFIERAGQRIYFPRLHSLEEIAQLRREYAE